MEDNFFFLLLKIVFPLALIAYYYSVKSKKSTLLSYWKTRGILQIEPQELQPIRFVGNKYKYVYEKAKQRGLKHAGTYSYGRAIYVPTDIGIIKSILIKDFEYFRNRGLQKADEKNDPLSMNIFALEDEKWRSLRAKLSPTFTSGKMKMMFPMFVDCTHSLTEVLNGYAKSGDNIDIKELLACFSTDVITSCAFGLDCHSVLNPNEPFRKHGKLYFEITTFDKIKLMSMKYLPVWFKELIGLRFTKKKVEQFFIKAVHDMVRYREENNIYRPDFFHLLLQLKNRGKIADDEKITEGDQKGSFINMTEFAAQCFVFFAAGFETSSSVTMFTLYELSKHLEIQDRLRNEIRSVLEKYNGKFTYEAVSEMSYLDQVVKEALRLYPSLSVVTRICSQDYKVPGTDFVIEKGIQLQVPVFAIHTDPEFYPDPYKFDPNRFTKENEAGRPACKWMPFGEGPRLCIGMRFGLMQVKMSLATIVKDFKVSLDSTVPEPLVLTSDILITQCAGKIYMHVEKV